MRQQLFSSTFIMRIIPLILLLMLTAGAVAQTNPYLYQGSIGTSNGAATTSPDRQLTNDGASRPFPTVQPMAWIGKRFLFLPAPHEVRFYAYSDFLPALPYDRYVGRIARVESISGPDYAKPNEPSAVHLVMEDNGERIQTHCNCARGSVTLQGLGLTEEIDNARAKWRSTTLFLSAAVGSKLRAFDAASDESHDITVKRFSPVVVKDIVAGYSSLSPVRFILRTADGVEGYLDVNVSNTNAGPTSNLFRFEDQFLKSDPRLDHKWPQKVWDAIEKGDLFTGMTVEQARMSWGDPLSITPIPDGVDMLYASGSTLHFLRGVLKSVTN